MIGSPFFYFVKINLFKELQVERKTGPSAGK